MRAKLRLRIEIFIQRRFLRRWRRLADQVHSMPLFALRTLTERALLLQKHVNRFIAEAEARLYEPSHTAHLDADSKGAGRTVPYGADWQWRPVAWGALMRPAGMVFPQAGSHALSHDTKFHHDCPLAKISVEQVRNRAALSRAPFALEIDVLHYRGSWLALIIDVPRDAMQGLRLDHLIKLDVLFELERPSHLYAGLHIHSGPDLVDLPQEIRTQEASSAGASFTGGTAAWGSCSFDIAYSEINPHLATKAHLNIHLSDPQMNRLILHDVILTRQMRGDI